MYAVVGKILVRKVYGDSQRRQKKRKWKLRHLNGIDTLETENHDRSDFTNIWLLNNVLKPMCYEVITIDG